MKIRVLFLVRDVQYSGKTAVPSLKVNKSL